MSEMHTAAIEVSVSAQHTIRGTHWRPDSAARGVIQIFHGLGEHHQRYERFAQLATARGLAVVAHDHRGHGEQAELPGHFSDSNGWQLLIDDAVRVNDTIREQYANVPTILLGHSMGSYVAQYYAMHHGDRLDALVLSASTWPQKSKLFPGRIIARIEAWRIGVQGKSELLHKLGFGAFNKPFEPARTELDWLSRDEAEVDAYIKDPLCGGPYSCGLWLDLMGGLGAIASDKALQRIRSDLPILLTGGSDDPVGGERGLTALAMHYAQTGHSRMTLKLYSEGRHEMLNEINRDEFSADVLNWVEQHLPRVAGA